MSDQPINVKVHDLDAVAEEEALAHLNETDGEDTMETPEGTDLQAGEYAVGVETVVAVETDEERTKREAREANEARWKEERDAREALMTPFAKQLAILINQNLSKLSYGGKKISGAWTSGDGHLILTCATGDFIQISPYSSTFYMWTVGPAILKHAASLGHEPSEWSYSSGAGKFSACSKCDAMGRIVEHDDGVTEVIAPTYMAACKGKR